MQHYRAVGLTGRATSCAVTVRGRESTARLDLDLYHGDTQCQCCNLGYLGVDALTNFNTSVGNGHCPIFCVDTNQHRKVQATNLQVELDRHDRYSSLHPSVSL